MGNQPNTSAWFGKCGLSATLFLVACGIAAARFGHALQLPATTSRDGALVTLNRYVDNPIPDIVLTGSSMTFRLKEEYFETPRLRNLALAGGSVVTGLQIVAGQRQIPKMVVVEINVLSRPPDQKLVERYSADHGRDGLFLRPIRTAIAAYENWIHAPVSHAQVKASLQLLLEQAPSNFDNHVYLERAIQQMEDEDPTPMAEKNVEKLRQLIDLLEQRGARVRLLEMPYAAPIETSRYARTTREIVHTAFPDARRWLPIDLQRAALRWADGVHLDERSAVLLSRYLDQRFFSRLGDAEPSPGN
jgi:hypothetical protein